MSRLAAIFVGIVAVIHLVITVIEMFFWMLPDVYHTFNFSEAEALKAQPIVRNVGLYNAFLAAGLIWGVFGGRESFSIRAFFLVCVIIAGIFGAATLPPTRFPIPTTLMLQTIPALIALGLVWAARPVSQSRTTP